MHYTYVMLSVTNKTQCLGDYAVCHCAKCQNSDCVSILEN
jgi:hypothetical protein